jgi:TorA maturation chaperone TorD
MSELDLTAPRAVLYGVLASLYVSGAMGKDYDSVVQALENISAQPFVDEIKEPVDGMLSALKSDKEAVFYEFELLFNLPFGDFINSSVSFYHDEREFGEQTITAKEIMHEAGFVKADIFTQGEDDFGLLCALSAKLLKEGKPELQARVFKELLLPYIGGFLDAQLRSARAEFYKNAAKFFALFMAFEKSYFELN